MTDSTPRSELLRPVIGVWVGHGVVPAEPRGARPEAHHQSQRGDNALHQFTAMAS